MAKKSSFVLGTLIVLAAIFTAAALFANNSQTVSRYDETITIGDINYQADIARTVTDLQHGLSDSPQIAADQAMVFIFPTLSKWGIWMKDMNYPIDILWLDKAKKVQHIVEDAQPDSYPETSFYPPSDARYVIELKSGTVKDKRITIGTQAAFNAE
ncbi:MAG: DUF192 domain-containing protein [Moraxellaceae bacterium]|nr:MAG: DUF192 domain-containing protein [Moraxellaceae bacterium]